MDEKTIHPVASAEYWTRWVARHDLRRGVQFSTDHLVGTAVLHLDDDRDLEDLQQLAADEGLDGLLDTVDLVVIDRQHDGSPIASRIVDIDLEDVRQPHRVHGAKSFANLIRRIRDAVDPRTAAREVVGGLA